MGHILGFLEPRFSITMESFPTVEVPAFEFQYNIAVYPLSDEKAVSFHLCKRTYCQFVI